MDGQSSVRMYVVRHAEHVTPSLTHLSRKGSLQAHSIANTLKRKRKVRAVYCSPRSLETAKTISRELDMDVTPDKRLLPYDSGRLTGLSREDIQQEMPEVYQLRFVERKPDFKVPDGESLNDRLRRVKSFLDDVTKKHMGEQVVIVTHGGIIDDLFRNAHSLPPSQLTGLKKPYGSLSVLVYCGGKFHEEVWGGVTHLPQVVAESPTGGQLYLFPHQVAGSMPMLRGDLGELCKPATKSETEIYEVMGSENPAIAEFAPSYLGKVVIDVKHILENQSALNRPLELMHSPEHEQSGGEDDKDDDALMNDTEVAIAVSGLKRRRTRSVFADNALKRSKVHNSTGEEDMDTMTDTLGGEQQLQVGTTTVNTGGDAGREWSVNTLWDRFIQHRKKKVLEVEKGKFTYLVMENLTHGLIHPHILDMKMGTQQHGSHESAAKKASKQKRVETTTSKNVGARISGMQVYDQSERTYVLKDKYWGRSLNKDGLYDALRLYVTEQENGKVRTNVVKEIILQLDKLELAVKSCCWKFYGCSILIVYDGASSNRLRDRLQSSSSESSDVSMKSNPESLFQDLGEEQSIAGVRGRSLSFDLQNPACQTRKKKLASVRLIDYAKTERYKEGTYDQGLVFGISNLRKLFSKILLESPCTSTSLQASSMSMIDVV